MKNIGLFRHVAKLVKRSDGAYQTATGVPTVFKFEASNVVAELVSFGDTSPFHDIPDGATVYIEIGVDLDFTQPEVAKAAEEFRKHGRRPKFAREFKLLTEKWDWEGKCKCWRPGWLGEHNDPKCEFREKGV